MPPAANAEHWQQALRHSLKNVGELLRFCQVPADALDVDVAPEFPLRVTRVWAARIRKGDVRDPLLRQVLPLADERLAVAGFVADPTGDCQALAASGLLHKYRGRCLVVSTAACAIHCRYCFRRHFPYGEQRLDSGKLAAYLRQRPEVAEVILSGGDPLMLTDDRLRALTAVLPDAVHTLRIHTRMPVVLPARVDAGLLEWLAGLPQQVVLVLHVNHARELDGETARALQALRQAGVHLLNQAVLLRGVNDSAARLRSLMEALFSQGVLPYYLHLLDPVAGAAHFQVPEAEALALHRQLRAVLPGYLVPRLAREYPGEAAKRVLAG